MLGLVITHGFERDVSALVKGISSDAVIEAPGKQLDDTALTMYLKNKLPGEIKGISASSTRNVIVSHGDDSRILFLRGVNGADESNVTCLASKIIAPKNSSLASLLAHENGIVVGKQCASMYRLWLGSHIEVYVPGEAGRSKIALEKRRMEVVGIFEVGLEEYDTHIAYCSRGTLKSFFETLAGADQIALSFTHKQKGPELLKKIRQFLPELSIRSWKELYPGLASSLELEKYAMSLALALIALVASMLLICLLFMFLQFKQTDIAILKTMGMHTKTLYLLFIRIGMTIVLRASLMGLGAALLIGWYIDTYKPIALPDVYYIPYLPAAVEPVHALFVALASLILGLLACTLPLRQLKYLSVASVLRGS